MATERPPALEVVGISKIYQSLIAVDAVSFTMYRGEAFGFLGPNGAGKSTFVKMITGLVQSASLANLLDTWKRGSASVTSQNYQPSIAG